MVLSLPNFIKFLAISYSVFSILPIIDAIPSIACGNLAASTTYGFHIVHSNTASPSTATGSAIASEAGIITFSNAYTSTTTQNPTAPAVSQSSGQLIGSVTGLVCTATPQWGNLQSFSLTGCNIGGTATNDIAASALIPTTLGTSNSLRLRTTVNLWTKYGNSPVTYTCTFKATDPSGNPGRTTNVGLTLWPSYSWYDSVSTTWKHKLPPTLKFYPPAGFTNPSANTYSGSIVRTLGIDNTFTGSVLRASGPELVTVAKSLSVVGPSASVMTPCVPGSAGTGSPSPLDSTYINATGNPIVPICGSTSSPTTIAFSYFDNDLMLSSASVPATGYNKVTISASAVLNNLPFTDFVFCSPQIVGNNGCSIANTTGNITSLELGGNYGNSLANNNTYYFYLATRNAWPTTRTGTVTVTVSLRSSLFDPVTNLAVYSLAAQTISFKLVQPTVVCDPGSESCTNTALLAATQYYSPSAVGWLLNSPPAMIFPAYVSGVTTTAYVNENMPYATTSRISVAPNGADLLFRFNDPDTVAYVRDITSSNVVVTTTGAIISGTFYPVGNALVVNPPTFTVTGFNFNSATGDATFYLYLSGGKLDFEGTKFYVITVAVSDAAGATFGAYTIQLNVVDQNDAPVLTTAALAPNLGTAITVDENWAVGIDFEIGRAS